MGALSELVSGERLLVLCGGGGVGKTSIAASLALAGAQAGRRTLVLTVDPARRLADAMGIAIEGNRECRVSLEGGDLHAMMLDVKATCDLLIERTISDPDTRTRIMNNFLYRQVSEFFAGTPDYMALEALYDVYRRNDYDLIVLDTPPTKNALEFLEAPQRMARFTNEKVIKWFFKPYQGLISARRDATARGQGRLPLHWSLIFRGGTWVFKLLSNVFGGEFLTEFSQVFVEFRDYHHEFHLRSVRIQEILRSPDTSFLLVVDPHPLSLEEGMEFRRRLLELGVPFAGLITNRVHPPYPSLPEGSGFRLRQELLRLADTDGGGSVERELLVSLGEKLHRHYQQAREQSLRDGESLAAYLDGDAGLLLARVPLFTEDIHDLKGLFKMKSHLFDMAT